jgi:uncharacterized protein (DUF488 family)
MENRENPSVNDPRPGQPDVCSIGYSVHEAAHFVRLLRQGGVAVLADVRSFASSRYMPAYNRPELEAVLRGAGIGYVFLGDDLGGRPRPPELYDPSGRVNYLRVRAEAFFRRGLERLCRLGEGGRVAMMCGEEDPLDCHRGLMITPALVECGVVPLHLRGDGGVETTAAMEERLLRATRMESPLFAADPEERRHLMARAYEVMAGRKAFRQVQGFRQVVPDDTD